MRLEYAQIIKGKGLNKLELIQGFYNSWIYSRILLWQKARYCKISLQFILYQLKILQRRYSHENNNSNINLMTIDSSINDIYSLYFTKPYLKKIYYLIEIWDEIFAIKTLFISSLSIEFETNYRCVKVKKKNELLEGVQTSIYLLLKTNEILSCHVASRLVI